MLSRAILIKSMIIEAQKKVQFVSRNVYLINKSSQSGLT